MPAPAFAAWRELSLASLPRKRTPFPAPSRCCPMHAYLLRPALAAQPPWRVRAIGGCPGARARSLPGPDERSERGGAGEGPLCSAPVKGRWRRWAGPRSRAGGPAALGPVSCCGAVCCGGRAGSAARSPRPSARPPARAELPARAAALLALGDVARESPA